MRKIYLTRLLKAVALIVPLVLFLLISQNFLFTYTDHNTQRLRDFYKEEKNSLDVVLMGASEVHTGFCPGYAYEQYGFTSYLYAIDSNTGSLFLPQLKEILNYQNPGLIIVDVFGYLKPEGSTLVDEERLRVFTENIPLSQNKLDTIFSYPCEDKLSVLFPYLKYHGSVDNLKTSIHNLIWNPHYRNSSRSFLKGASTLTCFHDGPGDFGSTEDIYYQICTDSKQYLQELLDYCRQEELNVLFVNFPRYLENEDTHSLLAQVKLIEQIVVQNGFPFLNLQPLKDEIGLDTKTDFFNCHHMNVFGQKKLTEYLGKLIVTEYALVPRQQSPENKAHWEECVVYTRQYLELAGNATIDGHEDYLYEGSYLWVYGY